MPDLGPRADDGAVVDVAGFVGEVVGHGFLEMLAAVFTTEAQRTQRTATENGKHLLCFSVYLRVLCASVVNPVLAACYCSGFRYSPQFPISFTSGSSRTPYRVSTSRWARSMSPRTSAAEAAPVLTK